MTAVPLVSLFPAARPSACSTSETSTSAWSYTAAPDPEKGYNTRVGDFIRALDAALEHAADVDLVLFPGDIYKNCDPTPTIQREFASRIRRVGRRVPVVIIPGNHDLPNTWARASSIDIFRVLEIDNVHVLRQPRVEPIETRRGTVLIAPLPYLSAQPAAPAGGDPRQEHPRGRGPDARTPDRLRG